MTLGRPLRPGQLRCFLVYFTAYPLAVLTFFIVDPIDPTCDTEITIGAEVPTTTPSHEPSGASALDRNSPAGDRGPSDDLNGTRQDSTTHPAFDHELKRKAETEGNGRRFKIRCVYF
jgi:hypothetical protein